MTYDPPIAAPPTTFSPPHLRPLAPGGRSTLGHVPLLGTELTLIPEAGRTRAHRNGQRLLVPLGADCRPALLRWYKRTAREEIATRLEPACAALGRNYERLTIRDQRTRWGSCSSKGTLSFNWRLLLAPEPVLDYVIWHEACHLVELNHSRRFWALVAKHCPEHREIQRWLRTNGAMLVL